MGECADGGIVRGSARATRNGRLRPCSSRSPVSGLRKATRSTPNRDVRAHIHWTVGDAIAHKDRVIVNLGPLRSKSLFCLCRLASAAVGRKGRFAWERPVFARNMWDCRSLPLFWGEVDFRTAARSTSPTGQAIARKRTKLRRLRRSAIAGSPPRSWPCVVSYCPRNAGPVGDLSPILRTPSAPTKTC